MRILLTVLFVIAATACAPAVVPSSAQDVPTNDRLVYGLTLQPSGFDPHIHSSSELGIPLRQVYDTLVYRDPGNGNFVPGLAQSWEISADGLIYTFMLRQGVTFHDGEPFNAAAVGANIDRILDPATASQRAAFMLGAFVRYEIVDDYTIRLTLAEPYAPLLDSFSQVYLGIASPAALRQYSPERYQFHQIGTGPYIFEEYVPGDRLVLRRNAAYAWPPVFYPADLTSAPEVIEFRFFADPPTRALALESGDAQIVGEIPPVDAEALTTTGSEIAFTPVSIPGQPLQFMINTARYPTDNPAVRQALLFAANREEIIDAVYRGFSPVAWGPLAASTPFFNVSLIGTYAYDSNRARTLLTEAGFTDTDNNGLLDFGGVDLEINVIVPPWGLIPEVAQLLQDQWRDIGIRTTLNPVPSRSTLIEAVNQGTYHLVAFYEFGADPAFLSRYFMTDGVNNWMNVSDPTLDQLLTEASRQADPAGRAGLYAQAQQIIMEQALILPIRDYVNLNGSMDVEGLSFDAYGWFPVLPAVQLNAP